MGPADGSDRHRLRELVDSCRVSRAIYSVAALGMPDLLSEGPKARAPATSSRQDAGLALARNLPARSVTITLEGRPR